MKAKLVFIGVLCLLGALLGVSAAETSDAAVAAATPVVESTAQEETEMVALEAGAEAEAGARHEMFRRRRRRRRHRAAPAPAPVQIRYVTDPSPQPNWAHINALAAQQAHAHKTAADNQAAHHARLLANQRAAHTAALARQQAGARMHASRAISQAVAARSRHCNTHCTQLAIQRFAARMKALTGPLPNSFVESGTSSNAARRRRRWRRRHRAAPAPAPQVRVIHRPAPVNLAVQANNNAAASRAAAEARAVAARQAADRTAAGQRANAERVAAQQRATAAQQAAESLRRSLLKVNQRPCVCTNHINSARNKYKIALTRRNTQIARHQRTLQAKRMAEAQRLARENAEKARKAAELAAKQRAEAARKAKEMADAMAAKVKNLPKAAQKVMKQQMQKQIKQTAAKAAKAATPNPRRASQGGQETHARLDSAMQRVARATESLTKLKKKISSMRKALKSNAIKNVIRKEAEGAVRNYLTSSGVAQPKSKDRIKQWVPADLISQHKLYKYYATAEKPVYLGVLNKANKAGKDAYTLHGETLTFLEDDQIAHKQAQQLKEAAVRRMR